jgi:hypothetical protein
MAASDMEMFEAQEHIAALEAEVERLRGAINEQRNVAEATLYQYVVLMKHAERLRDVVDAAKEGCDACHKYNGADYCCCCDCYHAGSGTHDALAALDEEATDEW